MRGVKPILSAKQVYARLTSVRRARQERLLVFCLNTRGRQISRELVSMGTLNATLVDPRAVFYPAIVQNAASIIVAHNHPSGDSEPSADDLNITDRLVMAGRLLGIEVADHVIVAEGEYTSLRERGLMD